MDSLRSIHYMAPENLTKENVKDIEYRFEKRLQTMDQHLIFDLSQCKKIDVSGIALLVYLYKELSLLGLELGIIVATKQPKQMIQSSGLHQVIPIKGL